MKNEINNYLEYLFALALHKCGNLHDAEDLTQDTLLAAYQYIRRGGVITNINIGLLQRYLTNGMTSLEKSIDFQRLVLI